MRGGFSFCKNCLVVLNVCHVTVALVLMAAAAYMCVVSSAYVDSALMLVIGGIAACGVVFLLVSSVGLIATIRQHQVLHYPVPKA